MFFHESRTAHKSLSKIFDFVWPTLAAMWNLRWQVSGFLANHTNASEADLEARFIRGSHIHGANLRRTCQEVSWKEHELFLGRLLLIDVFALYEGWAISVLGALHSNTKAHLTGLQYPASSAARTNVATVLAALTSTESRVLRDSFYPVLIKSRFVSGAHLDAMLSCYRFFKEIRNCLVHSDGIADQRLLDAYNLFARVATPEGLGVKMVPQHDVPILGMRHTVHLRGIVGFTQVVLRLIATIDAELSRSIRAESYLRHEWSLTHGRRFTLKTRDADARSRQVARLFIKLGLPAPVHTNGLELWLRSEHLVG